MTNGTDPQWLEFRPRPSSGRYWAAGLGFTLLLLFAAAIILARDELSTIVLLLLALLGLVVTAPLLALAWYFPQMRYRLGRKELELSIGPLQRDRVPIDAIRSIRRRNLRVAQLTAFRLPGLALLYVDYLGIGPVRMCATSSTTQILLIDIGHRRYGITPENEFDLVQAIRERSSAKIRVSENFNPNRQQSTTISR